MIEEGNKDICYGYKKCNFFIKKYNLLIFKELKHKFQD